MHLHTVVPLGVLAASASAHWSAQRFSRAGAAVDLAAPDAALGPAEHVVPITGKVARSQAKRSLQTTLRQRASGKNYTAILAGGDYDREYLADLTAGGQTFKVVVDTGRCASCWSVGLMRQLRTLGVQLGYVACGEGLQVLQSHFIP
jgi:hypothetical protein